MKLFAVAGRLRWFGIERRSQICAIAIHSALRIPRFALQSGIIRKKAAGRKPAALTGGEEGSGEVGVKCGGGKPPHVTRPLEDCQRVYLVLGVSSSPSVVQSREFGGLNLSPSRSGGFVRLLPVFHAF